VTDLQTDKSVHVTVTDRGPSKHSIMLDLSLGAANQLGLDARRGIATVRAQIIQ
jgi:rare lipoprotein A (peptidoglycan hydrolase)